MPVILLFKRILLAIIILSLARIAFWIFNYSQFQWTGISDAFKVIFWGGFFDLISLFYALSPFILVHLIPGRWFYNITIQKVIKIFFITIIFLLLTLTCIDAGYYPFSKSRLGVELFQMAGNEEISIVQYIIDYWWFVPFILGSVYLVWKRYPTAPLSYKLRWYIQLPVNIIVLAVLVLTIRGGFRLKPLRSIDTVLFVPPSHAALAISTGFNFLESFQVESIKVPEYFSEAELKAIMQNDYHMITQSVNVKKKNIVVIIVESFGKEYSFPDTKNTVSYTPFLRDLAAISTFYNRAYSNGTRSVDAIPAILEGVPKLTKTDFMYSNYIKNITPGFPYYLKKEGYECSFYHGGKNGTLGFEAFLKTRGWNYYGKNEYAGSPEDFDGQWGIYDGPYLQYCAKQLGKTKQPFVASVFTLSSHHPYSLPDQYKDSFKDINKPIHKTVKYADACLRAFFESVKNEPWFNETVFIITGDHSGENFTKRYQSRDGKYQVPLIVYEPWKSQYGQINLNSLNNNGFDNEVLLRHTFAINNEVIQHIDIIPLALDKAGYSGKIFTLGSYFDDKQSKVAFQNEEGSYQIISENSSLIFDGNRSNYIPLKESAITAGRVLEDEALEKMLKMRIQEYN